jgi:hypothetical protein
MHTHTCEIKTFFKYKFFTAQKLYWVHRTVLLVGLRVTPMENLFYIQVKVKAGKFILHTIKVKVKLSLCLMKHHAMKMYWGMEV